MKSKNIILFTSLLMAAASLTGCSRFLGFDYGISFRENSYTYEVGQEYALDYEITGSSTVYMTDFTYTVSEEIKTLQVSLKPYENADEQAALKKHFFIKCLEPCIFDFTINGDGKYKEISSNTVRITFDYKEDFVTNFYDADGTLISEQKHRFNTPIEVPVINDSYFDSWSDSQHLYDLKDGFTESRSCDYYAVYNTPETDGLEYEFYDDVYSVTGYNGHDFNVNIPLMHKGKFVRRISKNAFNNSSITSVNIPSSVKSINYGAFKNSKITKCNIPFGSHISMIGESAFSGCNSLQYLLIPNGTSIENSVFYGVSSRFFILSNGGKLNYEFAAKPDSTQTIYHVKQIVDRDKTNKFQYCVFKDNTAGLMNYFGEETLGMKDITKVDGIDISTYCPYVLNDKLVINNLEIGPSVKYIYYAAFKGNVSLTNITTTNATNLVHIDDYAFSNCPNLITADLNGATNLDTIDIYAFKDDKNMTSILIPDNTKRIGEGCFSNCSRLKIIYDVWGKNTSKDFNYNPEGRPEFGNGDKIVQQDKSLTYSYYIDDDNNAVLLNLIPGAELAKHLDLTAKVDGHDIVGIANSLYSGTTIESVIIPTTLSFISNYAFADCADLRSFDFENGKSSLTSIGYKAFSNCPNLEYVHLPSSLTNLGDYCFKDSYNARILLESMDDSHISNSGVMGNNYVYHSIKSVNEKQFNEFGSYIYCETYHDDLTFLKWKGTSENYGPTEDITIDSINGKYFTVIGAGAFENNKAYYHSSNFNGRKDININLGSHIEQIHAHAFDGLFEIAVGNQFNNTSSMYFKVNMPKENNLNHISRYAFASSHFDSNFVVGENVTYIGDCAFGLSTYLPSRNIYMVRSSSDGMQLGKSWSGNQRVYWGGSWDYNANGNPTVKQN